MTVYDYVVENSPSCLGRQQKKHVSSRFQQISGKSLLVEALLQGASLERSRLLLRLPEVLVGIR